MLEVISPAADRVAKAVAFTHYFGLSRRPASLLVVLYEGRHAHHPGESLAVLTLTTPRAIQEQIRQLRATLETEAIDFADGAGYRLTDVGVAECDTALSEIRMSLVRACAPTNAEIAAMLREAALRMEGAAA